MGDGMRNEDVKEGMKVVIIDDFFGESKNGSIATIIRIESDDNHLLRLSNGKEAFRHSRGYEPLIDYEIGDKVRITGKYKLLPWVSGMERLIGEIYEISSVYQDGTVCAYFNLNPLDVELVEEKRNEIIEMDVNDAYYLLQSKCGIDTGDRVRILRKFLPNELGCGVAMNTEGHMDDLIGKTGIVQYIYSDHIAVRVDGEHRDWCYPWFVLEKIYSEPKTLTWSDLTNETLIATREKWQRILDRGTMSLIDDWTKCAVCSQVMDDMHLGCDQCPLIKDSWCGHKYHANLLILRDDVQKWKADVAAFLCVINKELASRK